MSNVSRKIEDKPIQAPVPLTRAPDVEAGNTPLDEDPMRSPVRPAVPATLLSSAWRHALAALALGVAAILGAYGDTAASIVGVWATSETFAHGFVVVPVSLWLMWRRRELLRDMQPAPSWTMLAPLALLGIVWLLGALAVVNAVTHLAMVAMIIGAVAAILGVPIARAIGFPLAFLFFAVPIGEFLLPALMEWTADFTVLALRLSGVPVYRDGQQFSIPSGNWSVVEACSGVRYLIASLMVGTVYAYLNYESTLRRLAFVGVSILVPIVANWVRAYGIVMLGHLSNNTIAVGVDHLIYGWVFFGVVMVLMFWIGSLWREPVPHVPARPSAPALGVRAPSNASLWFAAAAVIAATVSWPLVYRSLDQPSSASAPALDPLPGFAGWRAVQSTASWEPRFVNPSVELNQRFEAGSQSVGLYVAYYVDQRRDSELVSSQNVIVPNNVPSWSAASVRTRTVLMGERRVDVRVEDLRGPRGERAIAWRWYWIDGMLTASDHRAKIATLWSRLARGRDDSAAVVVYAFERELGGDADDALERFVRDAWPDIESRLRNARGAADRVR